MGFILPQPSDRSALKAFWSTNKSSSESRRTGRLDTVWPPSSCPSQYQPRRYSRGFGVAPPSNVGKMWSMWRQTSTNSLNGPPVTAVLAQALCSRKRVVRHLRSTRKHPTPRATPPYSRAVRQLTKSPGSGDRRQQGGPIPAACRPSTLTAPVLFDGDAQYCGFALAKAHLCATPAPGSSAAWSVAYVRARAIRRMYRGTRTTRTATIAMRSQPDVGLLGPETRNCTCWRPMPR